MPRDRKPLTLRVADFGVFWFCVGWLFGVGLLIGSLKSWWPWWMIWVIALVGITVARILSHLSAADVLRDERYH